MNGLEQQLAFILEIDRLKAVYRRTLVKADENRRENSAEHSWQIALSAQVLHPYAKESVDIQRVTKMLLIHDVVEIDAGDLFAFDDPSLHTEQALKEQRAAQRIFGLLPQEQSIELLGLWEEFEAATTNDAKFAKSIDRILPLIQNMANAGGSWLGKNIKKSQVIERNKYLQYLSPELWQYVNQQLELACNKGWLIEG